MGESLLRSSHSGKSAALALALLPLIALDLSPVWAGPQALEFETAAFLNDPPRIIRENPRGGAQLVAEVRDLALSDPATLQPILGLLPEANKGQKAAIAAGLAWAARVSTRSNPDYANKIQQAVAQTKDQDFILAYTVAMGKYAGTAGGGRNGFGDVADEALPLETNGVPTGPGGPNSTVPPPNFTSVFVPGNIVSPTTTVPLATTSVPGGAVAVSGAAVLSAAVPNIEAPGVALQNVETAVTAPNFEASTFAASTLATPSVGAPSVAVSSVTASFALPNFFTAPNIAPTTTSINESVSPH
jgi:hypothetical protein